MLKLYHKKPVWLVLFIVWTLLIMVISLVPDTNEIIRKSISSFRWDYLEHFIAFFVFGTFYLLWRADVNFSIKGTELAILIAVSIVFAMLTEYAQVFIPGRTFNIIDAAYNISGVLASIVLIYFYLLRHFLRKKQVSSGAV
jgi:VanZ family protein